MTVTTEKARKGAWKRRMRGLRRSWKFRRQKSIMAVRNYFRRRRDDLGYIVLPIGGTLPERSSTRRGFIERQLPLPAPDLSIQTLQFTFKRIQEADNVPGVVILLQPLAAGLASLQSLRAAIMRLRDAGKRVVIYTPYLTIPSYYIGSVADMLIVPPSAEFQVLGLQTESRYFKDALAQVGIKTDVVAVSPYKSAGSSFSESTMPEQERAQLSWLLDENFDMLTADMADGRNLSQAQLQDLINDAPFGADRAYAEGLVDALAYDDEISTLIAKRWPPVEKKSKRKQSKSNASKPKRAKLIKLGNARKQMIQQVRPVADKHIGVINIEGAIMMEAVAPLIPFSPVSTAAQRSLVPLLRHAAQDEQMAALILHINSPGGDALASDLIWREVDRIRPKKPIVVYMNNVAASGGYYIAAGGSTIISQPGTMTGSIGVIITRPAISGMFDKLNINQVALKRGENAGLYRGSAPWSADEQEVVRKRLIATYDQFKDVVAQGRNLPVEELDPICEGRVWTGRQARAHKLVDEHGDFLTAIEAARKLANIPDGVDVQTRTMVSHSAAYVLPDMNNVAQPPTGFHGYVQALEGLFSQTFLGQMNGRPMMMMPFDLRFW
ncbi:MAG: signal peptide peptidase SppA [Candidatus Promineifilaceae bacterium]